MRHAPARRRFDNRTTREVEETRKRNINRKPYRTPELKALARESAVKVNGTWVSKAPVLHH